MKLPRLSTAIIEFVHAANRLRAHGDQHDGSGPHEPEAFPWAMCPLHSALTILKETPFKDDTSLLKRVLGVTYGLLVAKNQNPKDHDLKLNFKFKS